MIRNEIINEYFDWMLYLVCEGRFGKDVSYRKLLAYLHNTPFRWSIPKDKNRATDGITLRWRFAYDTGRRNMSDEIDEYLDGPCSVLEMLIFLAIRCEENIMDDPALGDRTGQWFWGMIANLGLGSMNDNNFDNLYVANVVDRFLDREYEPNGKGGLFTIINTPCDLRTVEIWCQLCWFLDGMV